MNPHKVRRLAGVLVVSQLRSGRSTLRPGILERPFIIAALDLTLFVLLFAVLESFVRSLPPDSGTLLAAVDGVIPFLPLAAVGVVVIAGTMFELTATARFSGSDAVNWMPVTPGEYVAASSTAIAYTYSPAVALILGALLPISIAEGTVATYCLALALTVVSLYEGALLVEMIRSASARASSVGSGRRGPAIFLVRAVLLIGVILLLDLALNPVFLVGAVQRFSAFPTISAAIPLFWSSRALSSWIAGQFPLATGFAIGQVAFVAVLGGAAARLRARFWVPEPAEVRLEAHRYTGEHPLLSQVGLSRAESALVVKDFRGFARRRELLPLLVVPIVLVLLLLIEGGQFGRFGTVLWVGWVAGFFGLLLSLSSVGQERRSFQQLFAFPISGRTLFRAKAAASLIPVGLGAFAMSLGVAVLSGFPLLSIVGVVILTTSTAAIMTLWGLVFAGRYSDFQERPRPQFLRPAAMIGASLSGIALLSLIIVPGGLAVVDPSAGNLDFGLAAVAVALAVGGTAFWFARSGFDALFREVPY